MSLCLIGWECFSDSCDLLTHSVSHLFPVLGCRMSGVFQEIIVTVRTLSHCQTWVSFFYLDPSLLCLPCWFQPTHPVISIFSTWPIQNLARMIMGAQQRTSQPISQWSQNETLGGNIWGWLTLLFLSAKRKWVLILKHEFPLETVSLNEHLKLQIVLCVVFFWGCTEPYCSNILIFITTSNI